MTDDIDNDGTTLHESGGVGLPGLPKPAGFRTRYRSEPNMLGHYPWTYADVERRRRKFDRPECEYEDLYTADQVTALLIADRAARPHSGGWLPIEEAPTDGTHVLVAIGATAVSAYCDDERGDWWEVNTHWTDSVGMQIYPTHWMPLPTPPSASDRSQT